MISQEIEKIREVVQRYIDATYEADIPALRSCFHKEARMTGFLGDQLLIGTPEPFFQDMASTPSMKSNGDPYNAIICSLSSTGRIGYAVVLETGFRGSGVIENHFQLIYDEGKWSIISKNFTTI